MAAKVTCSLSRKREAARTSGGPWHPAGNFREGFWLMESRTLWNRFWSLTLPALDGRAFLGGFRVWAVAAFLVPKRAVASSLSIHSGMVWLGGRCADRRRGPGHRARRDQDK